MDGIRRVAPGAAHGQLRPGEDPGDAVVAAGVDVPVVEQKGVRQAAQSLQRLVVVGGDGLLGVVSGGHHQGRGE